jgi:ABC-2 type transport system permease protein
MPIFDQGYQHWKGAVSGHAWRWMAVTRQGLRGQMKGSLSIARILLIFAWMPALVLVVALALWGLLEQKSETALALLKHMLPPGVIADPHAYRHAVWTIAYSMFFQFETFFIMLLVVVVGPNLISRDLRFNALPLYFSRPIRRVDYFLGKLGVIGALVAAVAVLPAAVAYVLGVCFSLDVSVVRDTWRLLPASILYGLVIVVSAGTLMLALSSLSRRSLYVGIAWVGVWIISGTVAAVLTGVQQASFFHAAMQEEAAQAQDHPGHGGHRSPDTWHRTHQRVEQAMAEAAPTNWRPLCAYTTNLRCVGEALLGTDAAWVEIGRAIEAPMAALGPLSKPRPLLNPGTSHGAPTALPAAGDRRLADQLVPQYPWTWSAGVLAALLGLSLWTLSTRVKSLDRLK